MKLFSRILNSSVNGFLWITFKPSDFSNEGLFSGHSSMKIIFPQYSLKCLSVSGLTFLRLWFSISVAGCVTLSSGLVLICLRTHLSSHALNTFLALFPTLLVSLFSFLYLSITRWTVEWFLRIISAISLCEFPLLKWFNYQMMSLQRCMSTHSQYLKCKPCLSIDLTEG